MIYALVKNGVIERFPYSLQDFKTDNPNISLPDTPTEAQLNEFGVFSVLITPKPAYNTITQNCIAVNPVEVDGQWQQVWTVSDASSEEIATREDQARDHNRTEASKRLSVTDWTTAPDVSDPAKANPFLVNVMDFVVYRNQVRQIAVNPPIVVDEWPILPNEVWSNTTAGA